LLPDKLLMEKRWEWVAWVTSSSPSARRQFMHPHRSFVAAEGLLGSLHMCRAQATIGPLNAPGGAAYPGPGYL
jgi:hypothetical protein